MLRLREKYLDKQRAIVKLKLEEMECQRKLKELKMAEQEIKPMIADSFSDLDEEYKLVTKIASSKNNLRLITYLTTAQAKNSPLSFNTNRMKIN